MDHTKVRRRDVLALMGTGAAASVLPRVAFGAAPELSFGFQNTSWGTVGMIAQSDNLFKKAGANVRVFTFSSGKATRDAMIAGRIDVGIIGATPFIVGAAKGDLAGIGVAMYAGKTLAVVGSLKEGLKSVADLKGKRVGSQLGSATDYVFQHKILQAYGLSASDVHVINVTFQNQIAALTAGSIDAFAGVEPFVSLAQVDKLGTVLTDYSRFDLEPVFLAANRPVVDRKREAVVAFLRGWLDAVNVLKDHPNQATKIVFDHFKQQGFTVTAPVIKLMLSKLDVTPQFSPKIPGYLDSESKELMKRNEIAAVPDWNKLLYRNLMQQAEAKV